ncbi:3-dehydroquinate dehydratase [Desulfovibrio litoralis DSM 11393]|uniref:3-dehydroquinate dehydratase n=2 Tax=Desulfovibrio litoralis TaxID=466107 RepID=A0A1M7SMD5_9BACT|nr:3-dehydroquinate dehydratase [Desulfovibrio litoralis DSM 11393]
MYKILILNGPNLGALGVREPEIYGKQGLDQVPALIQRVMCCDFAKIQLEFFQSNSEGALIDRLEQAKKDKVDGVAFNAGAYTHTSLALADCLAWIKIPCVEVHISNVFARKEEIRRQSYMATQVIGIISGFGINSYALAVRALFDYLENKPK